MYEKYSEIDFKVMKLIECKISIRLQDFQLKTSLKGGCNRVKILPVINSCLQLGFKDGRQVTQTSKEPPRVGHLILFNL